MFIRPEQPQRRAAMNGSVPRLLSETDAKVEKRATFDALAQYVDVTGPHKFVAPDFDAGDQRNPVRIPRLLSNIEQKYANIISD